ncbi:Nn.00g005620.m01.CDS01 [Neocucurbitaria sp. VM-36]
MTEVTTEMTLPQQSATATKLSQTTAMSHSVAASDTAMSSTMSLADNQIPICGISHKCLTKPKDHSPSCVTDDLECICKASNSLAHNTQFNQQCVFNECYGDIGLRGPLIHHCTKVDRELIDIPDRWKVYLPDSQSLTTTSPLTPTTLATTATNTTSTTPTINLPASLPSNNTPQIHLPSGAIAGIAIGASLIIAVLAAMGTVYWKARKKARKLTRENAILVDRTSAHGASARIEKVLEGGEGGVGERGSVAATGSTTLMDRSGRGTLVSTGRPEGMSGYAEYARDVHGRGWDGVSYGEQQFGGGKSTVEGQPFRW